MKSQSAGAFFLVAAASAVSLASGQKTRADGMCGEGNFAADGSIAECEYIPPFTTCCQKNGHCGWDCADGKIIYHEKMKPVYKTELSLWFIQQLVNILSVPTYRPVDL